MNTRAKQMKAYTSNRTKQSIAMGGKAFKVFDEYTKAYIKTYQVITICAEELNLVTSIICCCLKGRKKSHRGYKFEYVDKVEASKSREILEVLNLKLHENRSKGKKRQWENLEYREKMKEVHKKAWEDRLKDSYFRVTKNGIEVGIWNYQNKCAIDLDISKPQICTCLKGRSKSHKGYKFEYLKSSK